MLSRRQKRDQMLHGQESLQWLQILVSSLRGRVLSHAMVRSVEQFHAPQGI